jgi:serine/threonine-protein kinase
MKTQLNPCDPERLRLLADDLLAANDVAELEEHISECAQCRAALDSLAGGDRWADAVRQHLGAGAPPLEPPVDSEEWSLSFLAPSDWPDSLGRLGTYEVKGVLGRGGMGIVLKAFDPALNRNVAIKVLSAPLANCGAAKRRFLREARAAAAVVHLHVVSVFAVNESTGLPFIVMEYVPGRSLQDRLDRFGPLSLAEILRIGMQTAAGLAAAHAQGLIHRDVKPANILLENGVERVKLTDFGLARAAADAALTQSGVVAGTPNYMAPEQARGETADYRADLFSLGSTLYAMCTGHPPFRAESAVVVLRRVSDDTPRPVREINPDIPEWLEAIINKLHAKSPDERFQSAAEVADLLSRCLAHVQEPLNVPLPAELIVKPANRDTPSRMPLWRWARTALWTLPVIAGVAVWYWPRPVGRHATESQTTGTERPAADPLIGSIPTGSGTDEIERAIASAWGEARFVDTELHRSSDCQDSDRVSAFARAIAERAGQMEWEILAGRATRP